MKKQKILNKDISAECGENIENIKSMINDTINITQIIAWILLGILHICLLKKGAKK